MGLRGNNRVKSVVPIKVWGTDCLGKPFAEICHTLDISHSGFRAGGFNAAVSVGDVLSVQYRHVKTKFQVVWVGRPSSRGDSQIGAKLLGDKTLFDMLSPDTSYEDTFRTTIHIEPAAKGAEKRSHQRFKVRGGADVKSEDFDKGSWSDLADISMGGAYLMTLNPLRVSTPLRMAVSIDGTWVNVSAIVRTSHANVGMGVQFTEFTTREDEEKLARKLEEIKSGNSPAAAEGQPSVVKPDTAYVTERLKTITRDLHDVEQLIKSASLNPDILAEFRESVGNVRATSWAVQRWMELQGEHKSPFPVITYVNSERIRLATRLCNTLHQELQKSEVRKQKLHLNELLASVENLFTRLAGFDFMILDPTTGEGDPDVEGEEDDYDLEKLGELPDLDAPPPPPTADQSDGTDELDSTSPAAGHGEFPVLSPSELSDPEIETEETASETAEHRKRESTKRKQ